MVRTRANNAAVRKGEVSKDLGQPLLITTCCTAVVAKAPRKNIAAGRSSIVSPSNGGAGKRKNKVGGSGNPLKLWPVPKGQKGLQSFFGGDSGVSPSSNLAEETIEPEEGSSSGVSSTDCMEGTSSSNPLHLLEDITQTNSDSDDD